MSDSDIAPRRISVLKLVMNIEPTWVLNCNLSFPGPFTVPVDEEVESQMMKFLQTPPVGMTFANAVERFNANISYSGLLHAVTADVSTFYTYSQV